MANIDAVTKAETITCEMKTLSQVLRDEGVAEVDLLKVDVEKAEMLVLKGLSDADWKIVQALVAEVHDDDGKLDAIKAMSHISYQIARGIRKSDSMDDNVGSM